MQDGLIQLAKKPGFYEHVAWVAKMV